MRYANSNHRHDPLYQALTALTLAPSYAGRDEALANHGHGHAPSRPGLLGQALATLGTWRARHQQRRQLLQLDDHLLRDIGLTRAAAEAEWDKHFWQR